MAAGKKYERVAGAEGAEDAADAEASAARGAVATVPCDDGAAREQPNEAGDEAGPRRGFEVIGRDLRFTSDWLRERGAWLAEHARPTKEFLDTSRLSIPSLSSLRNRMLDNAHYFSWNYIGVLALALPVVFFFEPVITTTLVALALMALRAYGERPRRLRWAGIGLMLLSLFTGTLFVVVNVLNALLLAVVGHSALYEPLPQPADEENVPDGEQPPPSTVRREELVD